MEASCFPNTENRTLWFIILKILRTVFFEVDPNVLKFPPIISVPFDSAYLTFLVDCFAFRIFLVLGCLGSVSQEISAPFTLALKVPEILLFN